MKGHEVFFESSDLSFPVSLGPAGPFLLKPGLSDSLESLQRFQPVRFLGFSLELTRIAAFGNVCARLCCEFTSPCQGKVRINSEMDLCPLRSRAILKTPVFGPFRRHQQKSSSPSVSLKGRALGFAFLAVASARRWRSLWAMTKNSLKKQALKMSALVLQFSSCPAVSTFLYGNHWSKSTLSEPHPLEKPNNFQGLGLRTSTVF